MTEKSVEQLLAELRKMLKTQYERGGEEALRRILSVAKDTRSSKLRPTPEHAGKSARGDSKAARLQ